jgi:hypothetical protein
VSLHISTDRLAAREASRWNELNEEREATEVPMIRRISASAAVALTIATLGGGRSPAAQAQPAAGRGTSAANAGPGSFRSDTSGGKPDLQGIWSFATLTPLERPAEFAGRAFLTEAEAAEWEKQLLARNNVDQREGIVGTRVDVDRAYNDVWWDRGTKGIGTRRTSLIVDPPDGKIPALTPEGTKRFEAYGGFSAGSVVHSR